MALTAIAASKAKPRDKNYKLSDSRGLYLLVTPSGGRYWRLNYRFDGKARTMALGVFPEVTLAAARDKRDEARRHLQEGRDPTAQRREEAAEAAFEATTSFRVVAEEWLEKREREGLEDVTLAKARWLLGFAYPALGDRKISEITTRRWSPMSTPLTARLNGPRRISGSSKVSCRSMVMAATPRSPGGANR